MKTYNDKELSYPWTEKRILLKTGNLVNHILYGKEWLGIVVKLDHEVDVLLQDRKVLVHMLPGTKYEDFFGRKYRPLGSVNDVSGWIYHRWIRKIKAEKY